MAMMRNIKERQGTEGSQHQKVYPKPELGIVISLLCPCECGQAVMRQLGRQTKNQVLEIF